MKLIRMIHGGAIRPGIWKDGLVIDLRMIFPSIPDIGEDFFKDGWIDRVLHIDDPGRPLDGRLVSPVNRPSKIICLGKNYAEHAKEGGFDYPAEPLLFCKAPSALTGPYDPIQLPRSSNQVDWEVELAVIIGKTCKRVDRSNVMDYIAGFSVMNDVSARKAQFGDAQWFRGKSFDTFAPLGPFLVTPDEIGNIDDLQLKTLIDGMLMQDGNTRDMIFDISFLIEYISQDITLLPGDIVSTGTPAGVGIFRNPPMTLRAGNIVECSIEKIGTIRNPVVEG